MAPKRGAAPRHEAGETLAEILVTIAILGLAIVVITAGLGAAIISSDVHRSHATANATALSTAECLKDRTLAYQASGNYTGKCPGSGFSIAAQWWNGDSPATFSSSQNSNGLEQLTVTATSGQASETVTLLKRST
jgi:type II secretory pathway pseudopilin PulG